VWIYGLRSYGLVYSPLARFYTWIYLRNRLLFWRKNSTLITVEDELFIALSKQRQWKKVNLLIRWFGNHKKDKKGVISGFRRDVNEICALLGSYETYSGNSVPTFRDNLSVPSSRFKNPKKTLEDATDGQYRKVGEKLMFVWPCIIDTII